METRFNAVLTVNQIEYLYDNYNIRYFNNLSTDNPVEGETTYLYDIVARHQSDENPRNWCKEVIKLIK
jgi:hypothetical protein